VSYTEYITDEFENISEYRRRDFCRKSRRTSTLEYINNNTSIHHTSTRMYASACVRERPREELRNCGIQNPTCWECRFFNPEGNVDQDQPPPDECHAGECRRHPPITDHDQRDAKANWAAFPLVMACDWCGEYRSRTARLPRRCDVEQVSACNANARKDATDENVGANVAKCQCGTDECQTGRGL
jgi:hypothetical protein